MDLKTNAVRWHRQYDVADGTAAQTIFVTGFAVSPDGALAVVYSTQREFWDGISYGYFFVIRASDGGYSSKKAVKIMHVPEAPTRYVLLSSSSIYFTNYGKVLLAFTQDSDTGSLTFRPCANGNNCSSRMRIAQYNVAAESFDWYYEQEKWFGQSVALAYGHWGETADNIYLGGAADHSRW